MFQGFECKWSRLVVSIVTGVILLIPIGSGMDAWGADSDGGVINGRIIENRGQLDGAIKYYARLHGMNVGFLESGIMIDLWDEGPGDDGWRYDDPRVWRGDEARAGKEDGPVEHWTVLVQFDDVASGGYSLEAVGRESGHLNFYRGRAPQDWQTQVSIYRILRYRKKGSSQTLEFWGENGSLCYRWKGGGEGQETSPGFTYHAAAIQPDPGTGILVIQTPIGRLAQIEVDGDAAHTRIVRLGGEGGGGEVLGRDASDYLLWWSSYLGGGETDFGREVCVNDRHEILVVGETNSTDFPATVGAWQESSGGLFDAFVAKISRDGDQLIWCTYVGGSDNDYAKDVSIVTSQYGVPNILVCGGTSSSDFPTTQAAYDQSLGGASDAFVLQLHHSGGFVYWSTLLGGSGGDYAYSVAADDAREITVTGETQSSDFPTTSGAFDESYNGSNYDAFVAKFNETGSDLVWSTYVGGSSWDVATDLVLKADGTAIVVGWSDSPDMPTTPGAYQEVLAQYTDMFICNVAVDGSDLTWCTYLGGGNSDNAYGVALDATENVLVCGETHSDDFPTTEGAFDRVYRGDWDGCVAKLGASGTTLIWGTYLGAYNAIPYYGDVAMDIAVDRNDLPIVVGITDSESFPTTTGAYDESYNGGYGYPDNEAGDAFVAMLDEDGANLLYSTYLGGEDYERAWGVALDAGGNPVVVGVTGSTWYPTTIGAYDRSFNGERDLFVSKLWVQSLNGAGDPRELSRGMRVWPSIAEDEVRISWDVESDCADCVEIYDLQGRVIRRLQREGRQATWDLRDEKSRRVAAGSYWLSIRCDDGRIGSRRLVVLE